MPRQFKLFEITVNDHHFQNMTIKHNHSQVSAVPKILYQTISVKGHCSVPLLATPQSS